MCISVFGKRLSRKSNNVVVFPFAFHIAVQQPFKPLWSSLLQYDLEPFQASFALHFKSLLMTHYYIVLVLPLKSPLFRRTNQRLSAICSMLLCPHVFGRGHMDVGFLGPLSFDFISIFFVCGKFIFIYMK